LIEVYSIKADSGGYRQVCVPKDQLTE